MCGQPLEVLASFSQHKRLAALGCYFQRVPGDHFGARLVGRKRVEDLLNVRVGGECLRVELGVASYYSLRKSPCVGPRNRGVLRSISWSRRALENPVFMRFPGRHGETGIRTRDTTIFREKRPRLRGEKMRPKTGLFAGILFIRRRCPSALAESRCRRIPGDARGFWTTSGVVVQNPEANLRLAQRKRTLIEEK